jgi:hypothetical protein
MRKRRFEKAGWSAMRAGLLAGFEAGASQAGHIGNGREPPRPCENVRERRNPRIVFSIAFFGQPPPELLVLRLKKSRKTFYAQIERGSFRTASVDLRH